MKFVSSTEGSVVEFTAQTGRMMQAASVGAVTDAGNLAKAGGRASIAAGGFSAKWQNALRSKVYPNAARPLSPAVLVWHKIRYSGVFETGATVKGKPLLWVPLPQVPPGRGKHALTPSQYISRIGPLKSINVAGRAPLLIGRGSRAGITKATETRVRVRKRAVKSGSILGQWVPLFVGKPAITDPQRFNITASVRKASEDLPALYERRLGKVQ